jgi:hypothetical protein
MVSKSITLIFKAVNKSERIPGAVLSNKVVYLLKVDTSVRREFATTHCF